MKIILASGSPRRRELLTQAGIEYVVEPADVEEITKESGLSRVDVENAINALKSIIKHELMEGGCVEIDDFGAFGFPWNMEDGNE